MSEFFEEAHTLCGNQICTIRTPVFRQSQTRIDALGIDADFQDNDVTFTADVIAPVTQTTITQRSKDGGLQLAKAWHINVNIQAGQIILPISKITLPDDTERSIIKMSSSRDQRIYNLYIA